MGDGYAPCHIAISNGDLDCLVVCLRAGADSEVRNFRGETPQQAAYLASGKNGKCPMVSPSLFFSFFHFFLASYDSSTSVAPVIRILFSLVSGVGVSRVRSGGVPAGLRRNRVGFLGR